MYNCIERFSLNPVRQQRIRRNKDKRKAMMLRRIIMMLYGGLNDNVVYYCLLNKT